MDEMNTPEVGAGLSAGTEVAIPSGTDQAESSPATQGEQAPSDAATEERVPFDQHPAWKRQMAQRHAALERAQRAEQELEQVRQQYERLSPYETVVAQLRAQGYDSGDAIFQALQAQQQENEIAQYGQRLEEQGYDEYQRDQILQERRARLLAEHERQYLSTQVVESAMRDARRLLPDMDPGVEKSLRQLGDPQIILESAQALASYAKSARDRAIADYVAQKARDQHVTVPEGAAGQIPLPAAQNYKPTGNIMNALRILTPGGSV